MMKRVESMNYDAIVVGGGVAGLTAACYLSKAGYSTLVCEKQTKCGGLVNSFERNGFVYDGGIRAMENAGALFPMLKHLGIEVEFIKNHVSIGIEDRIMHVTAPESADEYGDLLSHFFPQSENEIKAIIADMRKIMRYMDVQYGIDNPIFLDMKTDQQYFLKEVLPWMVRYIPTVRKIATVNQPVAEYLRGFTSNQALIDAITQHFFTDTPAFFALSYLRLFLDYQYPRGGTRTLIEQLVQYIPEHGGEIRTGIEIASIDMDKKTISDTSGANFGYRQLLWAADLKKLYQSIDVKSISEDGLKQLIEKKRESLTGMTGNNSVFTLFLSANLDKGFFGRIASEHFFYTPRHEGQSTVGNAPMNGPWNEIREWLDRFLVLTTYEISIPVLRDDSLAPKGKTGLIISLLFDYQLAKTIEDRGWSAQFRKHAENKIIQILDDSVYPGLHQAVIEQFSSTPLTLQQMAGTTDGAITGWAFTNHPMPAENRLARITNSINTRLPGIHQAGQWTFSPSGFPISLITGKLAADKIQKLLKKK
jgi:phytoene dehydrogenase-like protein